jgi:hypothetical protein
MTRSAVNVRADLRHAVPLGDAAASAAREAAPRRAGYLFHPITDFLLAGGGSVLVAGPVFWLIRDKAAAHPTALSLGFVLSIFINYPHFAHSYQLLYSGIGSRIFGSGMPTKVRLKYIWAGFVAPVLIGAFLIGTYLSGNVRLLGYAANAFWFTTGWHYVKQGYGVITVLSAIRRIYFSNIEKKLLLANGYAVWIYSWMALNVELHAKTFYGVKYVTFGLPAYVLTIGYLGALVTSAALIGALVFRVLVRKQPVSWNGVVGYVSSLYLWVIAFNADPIFTIFVPAFHSLQYLLFVWRYQLNKASAEATTHGTASSFGLSGVDTAGPAMRLANFVCFGLVLGIVGFGALPALFQVSLAPDTALWGPTVFAFIFVVWINLHHYFIDNVIWRRDNEDVRRFLFAPR